MLRELLNEVPTQSQTVLFVDNVQGMTDPQKKAEEKFLKNKSVRQQMEECDNSYDYEYLRKLLKASPVDALYMERNASKTKERPRVEVSHRSYENEFLREPKRNERACCKGNDCEGLKITTTD